MITKWDIISRMDPNTREIHYRLVMDGTEADARIVVKKLAGFILSAKFTKRPYVYSFRLPVDLDEVTLDKVRSAMREAVKRIEKMNSYVPGGVVGDPLFNTIIAPVQPRPQAKPVEEKKMELDLDDATIISADRIGGGEESHPKQQMQTGTFAQGSGINVAASAPAQPAPDPTPKAADTADKENAPTIVPLDPTKIDLPDIKPDAETKAHFNFLGLGKKKKAQTPAKQPVQQKPAAKKPAAKKPAVEQPVQQPKPQQAVQQPVQQPKPQQPVEQPAQQTPISIDLTPASKLRIAPDAEREVLPTPKEGLPTIDTALPERPAPKEQPAEVTPIKAAASDKTAILPEIAPIAEPSRPKSSQGQAQVPQESAPVDAPQPQVKPQPEVKPQPKKMFEAKPAAPDGFPEIHVQVRPVDLEASAEEKAAPAQGVPVGNNGEAVTPAPKQPLAAAEEKASAIAPEQPVSQTPQPAVAQTQDEMAAPAKTQPEPVKAEAPAAQAEPAPESEIPAAEQETHEPLNLSLEDMFMAETKYDMFVEVEPMEESASVGQTSQTGSAKKANHKK